MKRTTIILSALLLLALLASTAAAAPSALSGAAWFEVVKVTPNAYVTIRVYNFPANTDVKVYMGPYGSLGIGGALMGGFTTSGSGDFMLEMAGILRGQARGAIRLEAPDKGIYLSGNFNNVEGGTSTGTTSSYGTGGPVDTDNTGYTTASFQVIDVIPDGYVKLRTTNFPSDAEIKAYVGIVGGPYALVGGFTGNGDVMVEMTGSVRGMAQGEVRLESSAYGIVLSAVFPNVAGGTSSGSSTAYGTGGPYASLVVPLIDIVSVETDSKVTVNTANFPADDTFDVLMNTYGTLGIGGTQVDTISTGSGGSGEYTFSIPDGLKGEGLIAIRMESTSSGYYSYNWFSNSSSSSDFGTGGPVASPAPAPVTFIIPTFDVTAAVEDSTATIVTANFPAGDSFDVYINVYGTLGVGGIKVDTVSSGSGGTLTFTFNIPDSLKGQERLAIRFQSPSSGYFSYNWFWNTTY
jgi:hypothetical protein